ncbi:MAG: hypothetical protein ACRDN8_25730 [Thermoleophilaceae bacterium]
MRGNPFLSFHRTAEAAGYPALFIVSMVSLALVVAPVALLGATGAGWALALSLLSLIVAVAVLAGAIGAAFADREQPRDAAGSVGAGTDEPHPTVPRERRGTAPPQRANDRRAA